MPTKRVILSMDTLKERNSHMTPQQSLSKEQLITTLDAFVILYTNMLKEMPELQKDIDDFKELSAKLKATFN